MIDLAKLGATSSTASSVSSALPGQTLGKDEFLKLLVAQLSHQDPLEPMENSEFVAQLSQFSGVEQLVNVNENLGLIQLAQASLANGQAASLIGKDVEVRADRLNHQSQGPDSIRVELPQAAKQVTIEIVDGNGAVVRTLSQSELSAGASTIAWDGKDDIGNMVNAGTYELRFHATDEAGNPVEVKSRFTGKVTGLTFEGGVPMLEVGGTKVALADVLTIRQAEQS